MRIWSLHPRYLDVKGLVACWRETLLAQKVLDGRTTGYRNHPQLVRFRAGDEPMDCIGTYLEAIAVETDARGYRFNRTLILRPPAFLVPTMEVTIGQLGYQRNHLLTKLAGRAPGLMTAIPKPPGQPEPHRLFSKVPGPAEEWEAVQPSPGAPRGDAVDESLTPARIPQVASNCAADGRPSDYHLHMERHPWSNNQMRKLGECIRDGQLPSGPTPT